MVVMMRGVLSARQPDKATEHDAPPRRSLHPPTSGMLLIKLCRAKVAVVIGGGSDDLDVAHKSLRRGSVRASRALPAEVWLLAASSFAFALTLRRGFGGRAVRLRRLEEVASVNAGNRSDSGWANLERGLDETLHTVQVLVDAVQLIVVAAHALPRFDGHGSH